MIKYIHSLFLQSGYEDMFQAEDRLCMKHKLYKDYWIVYATDNFDLESQTELLEWSNKILSDIKESEKNKTLLILWKFDEERVNENILDKIIKIENDRFYFKKYVLSYTEKCWNAYQDLKITNIQDVLMDKKYFDKLKEETVTNDFGAYHLLYSMAHKLPFLMTNVTHTDAYLYENSFIPAVSEKELYDWATSIKVDDIKEDIKKQINIDKDEKI